MIPRTCCVGSVSHLTALCERFCSANHFIIRGCLALVPRRKALPHVSRLFQFVDHRDCVILN